MSTPFDDVAALVPAMARTNLLKRIAACTEDPSKWRSLAIDCDRILSHLQRGKPLPEGKGLKALLRHVRRTAEHPAARDCRERIALRGNLTWTIAGDVPASYLGYRITPLLDSHSMMRESAEMRNCVAEMEEASHKGHYRAFSLVCEGGERPRHTLVAAHMGDGEWEEYGLEDREKRAARDAKDVSLRICSALAGWIPAMPQENGNPWERSK